MMQTQGKRKRGPAQLATITPLLRHFSGLELRVELKNGRSYFGFLDDSDDDMNLILSSSTSSRTNNNSSTSESSNYLRGQENSSNALDNNGENELGVFNFSKVQIRGSSIRYIQFPDNADLPAMIRIGLDRKRAAQDKYARGKRQRRR